MHRNRIGRMIGSVVQGFFVASTAIPVMAFTWRCPDGTACIFEPGKGYYCPTDSGHSAQSCCKNRTKPMVCSHEHFPKSPGPQSHRSSATNWNCRFEFSSNTGRANATIVVDKGQQRATFTDEIPVLPLEAVSIPVCIADAGTRAREGPLPFPSRAPPAA